MIFCIKGTTELYDEKKRPPDGLTTPRTADHPMFALAVQVAISIVGCMT